MKDEQLIITDALKYAIQMELDGKKYYSMCGQKSDNSVGKELFSWLATQEDKHLKRFEDIYKLMAEKKSWPVEHIKPDNTAKLETLFGKAIKQEGTSIKASKDEISAIEKALEMEIKSRDFYKKQADKSSSDVQRNFFSAISAEEQGHYLALIDYQEYISDPVGWFTRTEHHLLDGA